ncbi:MAG TPA: DinB family protein [Saprospiraceae bacterium]|nr:DinB family protein [Saprospiraceae bacterium]
MINDDQKIMTQLQRMDHQKKELMSLIRSISTESYLRQPDPYTWSAAQIATHLYLSEKLSLAYLRKKLSYPDSLLPYNVKSWWSLHLVNFVLWSPIKVKAPAPINMWKESEILFPDDLDVKWNAVREEMTALIAESMPQFKSHLVYNHPLSGRMTMRQMLIFFNHHIAHHIRQIHRGLKKTGINR